MSETHGGAVMRQWLSEPLSPEIRAVLEQFQAADDVRFIAIMPDCHLAPRACNGCVVATSELIYPDAVGGDIGCGMAAIAFDCSADVISDENAAARVLACLYESVPVNRRRGDVLLPASIQEGELSHPGLEKMKHREGRVQFGTVGRGNHFVEFQRDEQDRLWLMVHCGSRAMGQAIHLHHSDRAQRTRNRPVLRANEAAGTAYLADAAWAIGYARENRRAIITAVAELMERCFRVQVIEGSLTDCNHNHVSQEIHFGRVLWVHRKGAMSAAEGEPGLIPGSMGTESYHVKGRGNEASLRSSSHGAGRALSRDQARRQISVKNLQHALRGVWFDARRSSAMREEGPQAYKDIRAVMRAQQELTRIVRVLRPVLCYKGN